MTPQERDVIAGIFDRLKQASNQPRDPEAERFIAERLAQQPYAPYAMAQAVYVQEQALMNMNAQIEQLQAQVQQLQDQPPQQQGGFLSSLFGGGAPARQPEPAPMQRPMGASVPGPGRSNPGMAGPGMAMAPQPGTQQGGPWAGQQPGQAGPWGGAAQQRQGGGFMQTAMMTAAGVAGGMVLGNVLMNAFQGDKANPAAAADQSAAAGPGSNSDPGDSGQPEMQPASYEDPGMFDDGGGSDEWA